MVQSFGTGTAAASPGVHMLVGGRPCKTHCFRVLPEHESAQGIVFPIETHHPHPGVEGSTHAHQGSTGIIATSREHTKHTAIVLMRGYRRLFEQIPIVLTFHNAQHRLIPLESFGNP